MDTLEATVKKYYEVSYYNCSETIIHAGNEYYQLGLQEEDMKMLAGFGSGMYCGTTCGTLIAAAKLLKENGATKVYAAVTHCLLNEVGQKKLLEAPEIEALITTDAVPQNTDLGGKLKVVSIAPLLGEAIRRIHDGKSVSSLFYVNH